MIEPQCFYRLLLPLFECFFMLLFFSVVFVLPLEIELNGENTGGENIVLGLAWSVVRCYNAFFVAGLRE